MKVLVTGATGFLGSHVVRKLVARGDDVRVLLRASSDRSRLDGLEYHAVVGDVTDEASVEQAFDHDGGVDLVFHCAAVVEFGPRDPSAMAGINVGGTKHVLRAAASRDTLVVHVSSLAALGATPADEPPQGESYWNPEVPVAIYEQQKREAHLFARELIGGGARIRLAMPGGIYGVGDQSTMFDLIRTFSLWPMPLGYLPEIRQSTVNVDDCADALIRIADRGADGEEYVVVAESTTIREWLESIARGAGRRPPTVYVPTSVVRALGGPSGTIAGWFGQSPEMVPETIAVATHDASYSGDKLRRELDWSPRDLDTGMAEMCRGIQAEAAANRSAKRAKRASSRAARV
jgi:dihydroflavonol-4-reductase